VGPKGAKYKASKSPNKKPKTKKKKRCPRIHGGLAPGVGKVLPTVQKRKTMGPVPRMGAAHAAKWWSWVISGLKITSKGYKE